MKNCFVWERRNEERTMKEKILKLLIKEDVWDRWFPGKPKMLVALAMVIGLLSTGSGVWALLSDDGVSVLIYTIPIVTSTAVGGLAMYFGLAMDEYIEAARKERGL